MLRLEDRIRVAMGANMGITLSSQETVIMAELLVYHGGSLPSGTKQSKIMNALNRLFGSRPL